MNLDDRNPTAAAPARAHTDDQPVDSLETGMNLAEDHLGGAPKDSLSDPADRSAGKIPEERQPTQLEFAEFTPVPPQSQQMPPRSQEFYRAPVHPAPLAPSIPEDLRVPWDGKDLLLFVLFGLVGLVVAGAIVAGIAVAAFHVPVEQIKSDVPSTGRSLVLILSQALWSVYVLIYFFVMVRLRSQGPFWPQIGWRKFREEAHAGPGPILQYLGVGAVLAVLASLAGRFVGQQEDLPIEQMFRSRPTIILLMAFGILVAPLIEETMFRGFLYPILARRLGVGAGVVLTGVLFGAMHLQQLWGGWGQVGVLVLVGIFLTWIRARSGTVAASYLVHLGYNSLLFLGFFAATGGLQCIPGTR